MVRKPYVAHYYFKPTLKPTTHRGCSYLSLNDVAQMLQIAPEELYECARGMRAKKNASKPSETSGNLFEKHPALGDIGTKFRFCTRATKSRSGLSRNYFWSYAIAKTTFEVWRSTGKTPNFGRTQGQRKRPHLVEKNYSFARIKVNKNDGARVPMDPILTRFRNGVTALKAYDESVTLGNVFLTALAEFMDKRPEVFPHEKQELPLELPPRNSVDTKYARLRLKREGYDRFRDFVDRYNLVHHPQLCYGTAVLAALEQMMARYPEYSDPEYMRKHEELMRIEKRAK